MCFNKTVWDGRGYEGTGAPYFLPRHGGGADVVPSTQSVTRWPKLNWNEVIPQ